MGFGIFGLDESGFECNSFVWKGVYYSTSCNKYSHTSPYYYLYNSVIVLLIPSSNNSRVIQSIEIDSSIHSFNPTIHSTAIALEQRDMQVLAVELEHLPTDLLVSIASLCDLYSIQQLSLVNKFFCSLCQNDRLWKHLLDN